jgi:cell fate regulator YaaT (PSP1 superfamily)
MSDMSNTTAKAEQVISPSDGRIMTTTKPVKQVDFIGVRFKDGGRVYHFSPVGYYVKKGDNVIVETSRGVELGTVMQVGKQEASRPLKRIIRVATPNDLTMYAKNHEREKEILATFGRKILEHNLDMKPIDIDCNFDGSKILFYFTADSRVDFRELVKDLAGIYRTRIELRQIGVRDEAKLLGGLGICGRKFCCAMFLSDFQPVSIKMAKEQSLSLNPTKISGTCGRLMCCLKYEQDCYEELLKVTPAVGTLVNTTEGRGNVVEVNLLTGVLKVKLLKGDESPTISVNKDDVNVIKPTQPRESGGKRNSRDNQTKAKQELRCDGLRPLAGSLTATKAEQEQPRRAGSARPEGCLTATKAKAKAQPKAKAKTKAKQEISTEGI